MRAFTIIEILIAFFILCLIAGGIFAVTNIAILSWNSNNGMLEVVQDVRQAMDKMTREARQSKPSLVERADTRLDFYIPLITPITPTPYISYYVEDNQLFRKLNDETPQILANNISALNFSIDSMVLQIQIQATKVIRGITHSFSLMEEVKLRNG